MEKLGIFKIIGDDLVYCGSYDNKEDALQYLKEIKTMIDVSMQRQLVGEYVLIPMLYFDIKQTPISKPKK